MSKDTVKNQAAPAMPPIRHAGLELLRCVAMMMVIVLHYLGKGNLLVDLTVPQLYAGEYAAWLLESFCIVAVNAYMFISGYFLCTSDFKPSRLIRLWVQVWMYSVAVGLVSALTGVMKETVFDTHFLLTLFFPISMNHYWFMTAYLFLYVLLPFLGLAVQRMTKRKLQIAVLLLLFVFSIQKSVLPVRLETDGLGYDVLWYVCVFMAAAYVRRFGMPFLEKKGRGAVLYVICCLMIFGGTFGLRQVYLKTGSLERMIQMCMEYNHILPFLAAVGLFGAFRRLKISGRFADLVCKIAPFTLGVYLFHENIGLRYTWQNWMNAESLLAPTPSAGFGAAGRAGLGAGLGSVGGLLVHVLIAVVCVFTVGILVDMLRSLLVRGLDKGLSILSPYRRLKGFVLNLDQCFRESETPQGRQ